MGNLITSFLTCGSLMIPAAVLLGNAVLCDAKAQPPAEGSLKISVLSGRPVVDGVYLNGQGPFRFLVDTGAQTNQVEASIARKLALSPTFRAEIATAAGNTLVPGGRVAEVTLGPATASNAVSNEEFLFTDLEAIHRLSPGIQGVLGQEFLAHFDYLLDFAGRRIVFGAAEPEGGSRMALHLVDGRPAVDTDQGRLVLDSGTETAILFGTSSPESRGTIQTASGAGSVSAVRNFRLRIAGRAYTTAAVSVPKVSLQEDGLVPASLFHAIYVCNSGKYLVIDPAPWSGQ